MFFHSYYRSSVWRLLLQGSDFTFGAVYMSHVFSYECFRRKDNAFLILIFTFYSLGPEHRIKKELRKNNIFKWLNQFKLLKKQHKTGTLPNIITSYCSSCPSKELFDFWLNKKTRSVNHTILETLNIKGIFSFSYLRRLSLLVYIGHVQLLKYSQR